LAALGRAGHAAHPVHRRRLGGGPAGLPGEHGRLRAPRGPVRADHHPDDQRPLPRRHVAAPGRRARPARAAPAALRELRAEHPPDAQPRPGRRRLRRRPGHRGDHRQPLGPRLRPRVHPPLGLVLAERAHPRRGGPQAARADHHRQLRRGAQRLHRHRDRPGAPRRRGARRALIRAPRGGAALPARPRPASEVRHLASGPGVSAPGAKLVRVMPNTTSEPDDLDRLRLYAYLSAPERRTYLAVMRLFTGTLLADLGAGEVASALAAAERRGEVDEGESRMETVVDRLDQLARWGNLVPGRRGRAATIAEFTRSRVRYQVSKLAMRVQRDVDDMLRVAEGAREVSRELLPAIARGLADIARTLGELDAAGRGEGPGDASGNT